MTPQLIYESADEPSLLDGFPCFIYEADNSFKVLRASANVHDIVGIDRDRIICGSWLFDEGVVPADRGLLQQQFLELDRSGRASLIHRLMDDRGRIVRVAHSLQRINGHRQTLIRGSILPLTVLTGCGATIDVGFVSKFLHKIGNHFQLLNLIQHSMRRDGSILNDLELVQETTEKAIDLTQTFSTFLEQPKLSTYVNLLELLESILESRIKAGREKNLDLVFRNGGSLRDATIQSDPDFLEMAIGAVMDDAIDASQIGGAVLIKISVPPEVPGVGIPRTVIIEVSHDPAGEATDFVDPVLEPFHTSRPAGNGVGLGLACQYIEAHGGLLRTHNGKDRGTVVEITLPVVFVTHARSDEKFAPSL